MKAVGALTAAVGLSLLAAHAPAAPTKPRAPAKPRVPAAADLFVRILQADDLFAYKGRQVTNYWGPGRAAAVLVFHRPLDYRRLYYLDPENLHGRLLVSDGRQQWQFDPRSRSLRHRLLLPGATDDDDLLSYNLLRANYQLFVDPEPRTVADRKTWLIAVKRPRDHTLARKFWVDAGSGLILKREIYGEGGKLTVTVTFSDITYHPKLDPGMFDLSRLTKMAGIKVVSDQTVAETPISLVSVRTHLAGKAYAPPALAGYRLIGASTTVVGAKPLLHLRYSDGLNLVSLFEQRRTQPQRPTLTPPGMRAAKIGPVPVHVSHRASLTTVNWDTATLNVTLMGEMGMETLRVLASEAVKGR